MIVQLSQHFLETGLVCPPGKRRVEYVSHDRTGLYVEVRSTQPGQGTYYYRFKDRSGKTCHVKLGTTADTSLEDARKKTLQLKAEIITSGKYPGENRAPNTSSFTAVP
jgi:hypothetical protein